MIVFVQPFGLNSPGGGPRILRSLLQNAPIPCLIVTTNHKPSNSSIAPEINLPTRPHLGRLEKTRFGKYFYVLESLLTQQFEQRLLELCLQHQATAIHAIAHSVDFWYAYQVAQTLKLPYYLTIHDDLAYALQDRPEQKFGMDRIGTAWKNAAARFVISEAMGEEYCRRYGQRPYAVVTDGLTNIPTEALQRPSQHLRMYFMGAVHLSYETNFRALLEALNQFQQTHPTWTVSLTIRGGVDFPLSSRLIPLRLLPWAPEAEVAKDLEQADVLYLPLPFGSRYEAFVKYSLSTKMVTYLGSGLPILYHGSAIAAANQLLEPHGAAILAHSLDPAVIRQQLEASQTQMVQKVANAIQLGRTQFKLDKVRSRFWDSLQTGEVGVCS